MISRGSKTLTGILLGIFPEALDFSRTQQFNWIESNWITHYFGGLRESMKQLTTQVYANPPPRNLKIQVNRVCLQLEIENALQPTVEVTLNVTTILCIWAQAGKSLDCWVRKFRVVFNLSWRTVLSWEEMVWICFGFGERNQNKHPKGPKVNIIYCGCKSGNNGMCQFCCWTHRYPSSAYHVCKFEHCLGLRIIF